MSILRARGWLRARPLFADGLLAAAVLAVTLVGLAADGNIGLGPSALAQGGDVVLAAAVLGAVAVALRRRWPWAAAGVVAVAYLAAAIGPVPRTAVWPALLVVLYTVAAVLPPRQGVAAAFMLAVPVVVRLRLQVPVSHGYDEYLGHGLVFAVCFLVGRTVHAQRAYTRALEERARTAEEGRESSAREAVLEERRRIARELHDVVAHHVSVMGVLAAGARRALSRDPVAADEALGTIEETGRTALREMRRLLDVLRRDDESDAALQPQPGLAGLEALADQVRDAGLPVELVVSGEPVPLDPGVDLTIFRIVQEALTNALKHAGQARASVHVRFQCSQVELRVEDDGAPRAGSGPVGHGLVGMRERVSLYGGTLRTGPRPGHGYSVVATIPLEAAAPTSPDPTGGQPVGVAQEKKCR